MCEALKVDELCEPGRSRGAWVVLISRNVKPEERGQERTKGQEDRRARWRAKGEAQNGPRMRPPGESPQTEDGKTRPQWEGAGEVQRQGGDDRESQRGTYRKGRRGCSSQGKCDGQQSTFDWRFPIWANEGRNDDRRRWGQEVCAAKERSDNDPKWRQGRGGEG